ncbi:MAG TPA: ArsR family transcriptional regulator [Candidatus Caldiarchaeum subterraneum]|uniref:ArsR family transcriptional regulator n=1 Tax=Caldiarchaeum subterraneum TaxID=311458 RepID=A0A832ZV87_CALS0|nr:ArsR family transcriptional regulator [Candidatus Caldarchaeum subterraneum]
MEPLEPRAILTTLKRNTRKGVIARSRLIKALRDRELTLGQLSREAGLTVNVARYHLHNLEREGIVARSGSGRYRRWRLTGLGQSKLDEITRG